VLGGALGVHVDMLNVKELLAVCCAHPIAFKPSRRSSQCRRVCSDILWGRGRPRV